MIASLVPRSAPIFQDRFSASVCQASTKLSPLATVTVSCPPAENQHVITSDIDECRLPHSCNGPDVSCHNLPGSYACVCHNESKEWTGSECVMRDICEGDGGIYNPCDTSNGLCVNTLDGPQCFCKPGFRLAPNGSDCEGERNAGQTSCSLRRRRMRNWDTSMSQVHIALRQHTGIISL